MDDAARLEALEFKCAHLERAIQELSDVLYQQSQRLDEAILRNQQLREQLVLIENRAGEPASGAEVPPHY
ncbi:MAG: SlyX family protein [Gammaproteobacteria bacterium]